MKIELQQATTEITSAILNSNDWHGDAVKVWVAFDDGDGTIITNPELVFSGRLDTVNIKEGTESVIEVTDESVLSVLQRVYPRYYTDEDQKSDYAGDTGFSQVIRLQELEIIWEDPEQT